MRTSGSSKRSWLARWEALVFCSFRTRASSSLGLLSLNKRNFRPKKTSKKKFSALRALEICALRAVKFPPDSSKSQKICKKHDLGRRVPRLFVF